MIGYYYAIDTFRDMIATDRYPRYSARKAEYLAALDEERQRATDAIVPLTR